MEFVDITEDVDESMDTINSNDLNEKASEEQKAKAELWKALTVSLQGNKSSNQTEHTTGIAHSSNNDLEKRAQLFGSMVADSLIQCETKDWALLKKRIMDIFYEYDLQKAVPINQMPISPVLNYSANQSHYQVSNTYTNLLRPPVSSPPTSNEYQSYSQSQ